jgi:hypothetical protein
MGDTPIVVQCAAGKSELVGTLKRPDSAPEVPLAELAGPVIKGLRGLHPLGADLRPGACDRTKDQDNDERESGAATGQKVYMGIHSGSR